MKYLKEEILTNVKTAKVAEFIILSSVVIFLPFVYHQQWVTGPIVNAVFILTLYLIGIRAALVLCLIPSLMALSGGLLPAVLAPVVPFIMIGNAILVISLELFVRIFKQEDLGYWLGLLAGAVSKWLFLTISVGFISPLLLKSELLLKVAQMMSWPQLVTTFSGGVLAWFIISGLRAKNN